MRSLRQATANALNMALSMPPLGRKRHTAAHVIERLSSAEPASTMSPSLSMATDSAMSFSGVPPSMLPHMMTLPLPPPNEVSNAPALVPGQAPSNPNRLLYQWAQGSKHAGGMNILLADGSVHFIKNSISRYTWVLLQSTNDRLVPEEDY